METSVSRQSVERVLTSELRTDEKIHQITVPQNKLATVTKY